MDIRTPVTVVGAGLAGTECALQLADLGYSVVLYEMRGVKMTPAHKTIDFAELVCSNSFGSSLENSAPGQLKWEAEQLNCHILSAAQAAQVPAGNALAVDRQVFAKILTEKVNSNPRIEVRRQVITSLNEIPRPAVIATGPLTESSLASELLDHFGEKFLYFFDAIAPIIDADTIDMSVCWKADRWDQGTQDYINCPLNKDEYLAFAAAIESARKIESKDFEKDAPYFEGCMPIEALFERGLNTPRFGPMKPAGLTDPRTGRWPYAVVQLRQDNLQGTAFNMVGFQTKLAYPEQKQIFRMIPGLQNAEFHKLGSIHRNLFINTPSQLTPILASRKDEWLFFAGQITGVEGYFDSTSIALLVAHFVDQKLRGREPLRPPVDSAMGALLAAITAPERAEHFQPTNINFGLLPAFLEKFKDRDQKKKAHIARARTAFANYKLQLREQLPHPQLPREQNLIELT